MREKEFRAYLRQTKWYKESHSPKKGLDRVVSNVKEFGDYLKGQRGRTLEKANPRDIADFIKYMGNEGASRGHSYVIHIKYYYEFLKRPAMIKAADEMKRGMEEWNWTNYVAKREVKRRLSYGFVRDLYDFTMSEAIDFVKRYLEENDKVYETTYDEKRFAIFASTMQKLEEGGIGRLSEFVESVETTEKAKELIRRTGIPLEDLKVTLIDYVDRAILPEQKSVRLVIDNSNPSHVLHVSKLGKLKLANNLALLDAGRTKETREELAKETGIPEEILTEFVNRADISRKINVAKAVDYYCKSGYDTFEKIRMADHREFRDRVWEYASAHGITSQYMIDGGYVGYARVHPRVVQ